MTLPKIDVPVFTLTLPYSEKKIQYRPFTVKEEKILLFGQQSRDPRQIALAVKQVVQNCIMSDHDITDLPSFEVDYLFLKLRSVSVNNVINVKIKDEGDDQFYDAEVDLEQVNLVSEKTHPGKFSLNDTYMVKLRFPSFKNIEEVTKAQESLSEGSNAGQLTFDLVGETIESVYNEDGSEVFFLKDYDRAERVEFLESLSSKNFTEIQAFLSSIPQLRHTVTYEKEDGTKVDRELRGLFDFFMFA
jgi:DNA-binding Lrp family transcriptional regulator